MEETKELTREELLKVHKRRNINIVTNIILVIVLLVIGYYAYSNIELIKSMNQDWCRLCEYKTGAKCFINNLP
jgi:hypothetical protein